MSCLKYVKFIMDNLNGDGDSFNSKGKTKMSVKKEI